MPLRSTLHAAHIAGFHLTIFHLIPIYLVILNSIIFHLMAFHSVLCRSTIFHGTKLSSCMPTLSVLLCWSILSTLPLTKGLVWLGSIVSLTINSSHNLWLLYHCRANAVIIPDINREILQ